MRSSTFTDIMQRMSSKRKMKDNYKTDDDIKDIFSDWFDPCPFNENYQIDGLKIDWKDKTFVNPPYSKPFEWVEKAINESKKGKRIVMLLKVDTSTRWFSLLQNHGARFLWINGRLKHHTNKPAPFPQMLVIL